MIPGDTAGVEEWDREGKAALRGVVMSTLTLWAAGAPSPWESPGMGWDKPPSCCPGGARNQWFHSHLRTLFVLGWRLLWAFQSVLCRSQAFFCSWRKPPADLQGLSVEVTQQTGLGNMGGTVPSEAYGSQTLILSCSWSITVTALEARGWRHEGGMKCRELVVVGEYYPLFTEPSMTFCKSPTGHRLSLYLVRPPRKLLLILQSPDPINFCDVLSWYLRKNECLSHFALTAQVAPALTWLCSFLCPCVSVSPATTSSKSS